MTMKKEMSLTKFSAFEQETAFRFPGISDRMALVQLNSDNQYDNYNTTNASNEHHPPELSYTTYHGATFLLSRPLRNCRCEVCTAYVRDIIENSIFGPSEPHMIPTFSTEFGWWNACLPSKKVDFYPPCYVESSYIDEEVMRFLEEKKVINWCLGLQKLHPIRTTGDGNCLMHAVILATCGLQDCGMVLRRLVYIALVESTANSFRQRWQNERQRLNENIPGGIEMTSEEWDKEWNMVVSAAEDLRQKSKNSQYLSSSYAYLEEMHVFVLANVLRRPIIILGESMVRSPLAGDSIEHNNFVGIYLPLLWEPGLCSPNPILLCFLMSHFQPLLPRCEYLTDPKTRHSVPLVNNLLEPLHIHFLLPEEEAKVHNLLQLYLYTSEVVRPSDDVKTKDVILVADVCYSRTYIGWTNSDYYYLMSHYLKKGADADFGKGTGPLWVYSPEKSGLKRTAKALLPSETTEDDLANENSLPKIFGNLTNAIPAEKQGNRFGSTKTQSTRWSYAHLTKSKSPESLEETYVQKVFSNKTSVYWRDLSLIAKRCSKSGCNKFVTLKSDPLCDDHGSSAIHSSAAGPVAKSKECVHPNCWIHGKRQRHSLQHDVATGSENDAAAGKENSRVTPGQLCQSHGKLNTCNHTYSQTYTSSVRSQSYGCTGSHSCGHTSSSVKNQPYGYNKDSYGISSSTNQKSYSSRAPDDHYSYPSTVRNQKFYNSDAGDDYYGYPSAGRNQKSYSSSAGDDYYSYPSAGGSREVDDSGDDFYEFRSLRNSDAETPPSDAKLQGFAATLLKIIEETYPRTSDSNVSKNSQAFVDKGKISDRNATEGSGEKLPPGGGITRLREVAWSTDMNSESLDLTEDWSIERLNSKEEFKMHKKQKGSNVESNLDTKSERCARASPMTSRTSSENDLNYQEFGLGRRNKNASVLDREEINSDTNTAGIPTKTTNEHDKSSMPKSLSLYGKKAYSTKGLDWKSGESRTTDQKSAVNSVPLEYLRELSRVFLDSDSLDKILDYKPGSTDVVEQNNLLRTKLSFACLLLGNWAYGTHYDDVNSNSASADSKEVVEENAVRCLTEKCNWPVIYKDLGLCAVCYSRQITALLGNCSQQWLPPSRSSRASEPDQVLPLPSEARLRDNQRGKINSDLGATNTKETTEKSRNSSSTQKEDPSNFNKSNDSSSETVE